MNNTTKSAKKLEKINQLIQKNNIAFKKANKQQKRVLIAQDVLAQLKANRYIAENGIFVEYSVRDNSVYHDDNGSVQTLFATGDIKTCNVCALGGMFMSCTNLNNNTTLDQLVSEGSDIGSAIKNDQKFSNGLDKFFTKNQLMLIEIYFENHAGYFSSYEGTIDIDSSFYKSIDLDHVNAFYESYCDDKRRLTAIMQNIVDNNGTFVPKKLKV